MENRQSTRMPLNTSCKTLLGSGALANGTIVNISRGGALLELRITAPDSLPRVGEVVRVAFDLPRNPLFGPRSLKCAGRVLRAIDGAGERRLIAIRFTHMKISRSLAAQCFSRAGTAARGIHLVRETSDVSVTGNGISPGGGRRKQAGTAAELRAQRA